MGINIKLLTKNHKENTLNILIRPTDSAEVLMDKLEALFYDLEELSNIEYLRYDCKYLFEDITGAFRCNRYEPFRTELERITEDLENIKSF